MIHASRRHCLEALYKTQDKLEMRQMDITKDMRTTKHLLEENWQEELALIEQSRNVSLPEHENEQKMSRSAEFGGHVQSKRRWSNLSERKPEWRSKKLRGEMSEHGQTTQQDVPNEVGLDWEASQLQPGERRRGSSASQSTTGRCLNSTILEQFVTKGVVQA